MINQSMKNPPTRSDIEIRFRLHRHVQIRGIDDDVPHRPLDPSDLAADDLRTDGALAAICGLPDVMPGMTDTAR